MGLNENEIKLKVKQILELSKKNNQVRIYMNCKIKARDYCLAYLESIKSELMNACEITRDIAQTVYYDDASKEEPEKKGERVKEQLLTYALTVRSREDFIKKYIVKSSTGTAEDILRNFLYSYHKQYDGYMMDLRYSKSSKMMKQTLTTITRYFKMPNVYADEIETNSSKLRLIPEEQTALYREANAKMLNKRLRKMLELL